MLNLYDVFDFDIGRIAYRSKVNLFVKYCCDLNSCVLV